LRLNQLADRWKGRRWNWPVWLGFLLSLLAFVSYFLVFARFPITRNVPWVNFLLFGISAAFFMAGLRKAFGGSQLLRGIVASLILTALSVSIFGVFCFLIFHSARQVPSSAGSPKTGQKAPEFVLRDTYGNLVSLSTLLSGPPDRSSASRTAPRGVLLIFYRGYW
jgi:hypothetical protein